MNDTLIAPLYRPGYACSAAQLDAAGEVFNWYRASIRAALMEGRLDKAEQLADGARRIAGQLRDAAGRLEDDLLDAGA